MEINDSKSIVQQFLLVSRDFKSYNILTGEKLIGDMTRIQFNQFCSELQLLLDMKECVYNHVKQMEDGKDMGCI